MTESLIIDCRTAIVHSTITDPLFVVTSNRALRAAMKEEGIDFIMPGTTISHPQEK